MRVVLCAQQEDGSPGMELYSVYVPTNHIYVGDIFLLGREDVIHTNLSVREGLGDCTALLSLGVASCSAHVAHLSTSCDGTTRWGYAASQVVSCFAEHVSDQDRMADKKALRAPGRRGRALSRLYAHFVLAQKFGNMQSHRWSAALCGSLKDLVCDGTLKLGVCMPDGMGAVAAEIVVSVGMALPRNLSGYVKT